MSGSFDLILQCMHWVAGEGASNGGGKVSCAFCRLEIRRPSNMNNIAMDTGYEQKESKDGYSKLYTKELIYSCNCSCDDTVGFPALWECLKSSVDTLLVMKIHSKGATTVEYTYQYTQNMAERIFSYSKRKGFTRKIDHPTTHCFHSRP
jgi:hypothetical protein